MSCSTNLQNEQQHREQIHHLKRKHEEIVREFATTAATSSSLATSSPAKRPKVGGWHVKLALESPARSDQETDSEDGYSTVHEIETEECRDSDDTESLPESEHTAAFATIDVLEYEIETTSEETSDNESFCTESSATGSASDALYLRTLDNIAIQALYASSSGDEFIQVDTDDSDVNDPELGRADYWECVKCKNKQNNPLYRFCERCYQVRKSHFPPRPKKLRQRRRSNRGRKPNPTISNSDEISSDFADSPQKLNKSFKRKQEDSAGDSVSSSSDSEIEEDAKIQRKRASPKRRCISSSPKNINKNKQDCASTTKQHLALNSVDVVVAKSTSSSSLESDYSLSKQSTISLTGKGMFDKVLSQHDSGISSQEAGSSQESSYSLDLKPMPLQRLNAAILTKRSYDDTSESEEIFASNKRFKASSLVATSSNVSESSVMSSGSSSSIAASLRQIASDSSLLQPGNKEQQRDQQLSRTLSQNLDDDSKICRLCFDNEKSAVFVHTKKACSGCCYTCAMKSWKKWKECPFCKEKARNVIKLYSH